MTNELSLILSVHMVEGESQLQNLSSYLHTYVYVCVCACTYAHKHILKE